VHYSAKPAPPLQTVAAKTMRMSEFAKEFRLGQAEKNRPASENVRPN